MTVWENFSGGWEESPVIVLNASHVSVPWHSHAFYELVFIKEGYCLHHTDDEIVLAMEGDVLLIRPGMRHHYTGTRECRIYNCLFREDRLAEGLMIPEFSHMHLTMRERKSIQELLLQIIKEKQEKKQYWIQKEQYLLGCLLVENSRACMERNTEQSDKDWYPGYVTSALRYIDEHYQEHNLSVRELAGYVGVTADYLSRQFKKVTGIGTQEYIRRYRLSRAITCLQQGFAVSEAAEKSGFHSASYFSREFKKEMGVAPSRYKSE